jgi:hypothetical protein
MVTDLHVPIARLMARQGEILQAWGPVQLDSVTIAHFVEAEGWPTLAVADQMSPAILLQLGNGPVDVHADRRPHETLDVDLKNPVNGGTAVWWHRAVRAGDTVSGEVAIKAAYVRDGKAGPLGFVILETRFLDGTGALLARAEKTIIYRGDA